MAAPQGSIRAGNLIATNFISGNGFYLSNVQASAIEQWESVTPQRFTVSGNVSANNVIAGNIFSKDMNVDTLAVSPSSTTVTTFSSPGGAFANVGPANSVFSFEGRDTYSYVNFDRASNQSFYRMNQTFNMGDNGGLTFVALFKMTSTGALSSYERIFDFYNTTGANDQFFLSRKSTSDILTFIPMNYGGWEWTPPGGVQNVWFLISSRYTKSSKLLEAWNFNTLFSSVVQAYSPIPNITFTNNLIGRSKSSDPLFNGRMAALAMWDSALSDADLAQARTWATGGNVAIPSSSTLKVQLRAKDILAAASVTSYNMGLHYTSPALMYDATRHDFFCTTSTGRAKVMQLQRANVDVESFASTGSFNLMLGHDSAWKPNTSTWNYGSDVRVKGNIEHANLQECSRLVKSLPLRRFEWLPPFNMAGDDKRVVGWIAQEVKEFLPKAVTIGELNGIQDFHSLQQDQIMKMMYGALQQNMSDVEELRDVALIPTQDAISNVQTVQNPLDLLGNMHGYSYDVNGAPRLGILPSDVQCPNATHVFSNGRLGIDHAAVSAVLIEAVKNMSQRLQSLEAQVQQTQ